MALVQQFFLLLWKNLAIHRRKLTSTAAECILPTIFPVLLLILKLLSHNSHHDSSFYESTSLHATPWFPVVLGFVPFTPATETLANMTVQRHYQVLRTLMSFSQRQVTDSIFSQRQDTDSNGSAQDNQFDRKDVGLPSIKIKGFNDSKDAEEYFMDNSQNMTIILELRNVNPGAKVLPKTLEVIIHPYRMQSQIWHTSTVHDVVFKRMPRQDQGDKAFAYVETLVSESLISLWIQQEEKDPKSGEFAVYEKRFPVPAYAKDAMSTTMRQQFTLIVILSYMMAMFIQVKNFTFEKEYKIKESMRLMGMSLTAFWSSWFVTCFIFMIPAVLVFTFVLHFDINGDGAIYQYSDPTVTIVLFTTYSLCIIAYGMMISCIVNKGNEGAIIGGVLYLTSYVPYEIIYQNAHKLDFYTKVFASLCFNVAMGLANSKTYDRETRMIGIHWSNINEVYVSDADEFTYLVCVIMLVIDMGILLTLVWYLDNVFPGEFGVPKPYFFFLMKSYWCGTSRIVPEETHLPSLVPQHSVFFERDPDNLPIGVQIKRLMKSFGTKVSVSNLTLNMYEDQITVLLGHNGAGKTTTMSMLTGFIPPTNGSALVNGYDIRTNIEGVRKSLGLCPQHDILFDVLTVKEHLWFFAKLKGYKTKDLKGEIQTMVQEIGLESKASARVNQISGGQKRSLSVGISLMGGSKVVFLDEPSSGMDPSTRRNTWDLLQKHSKGRTILLSTHYMDEADTLGNRIAIMAEGKLQCCGTPMFLKKLYGAGYHLVIEKRADCDVKNLTRNIQQWVPGSMIEDVRLYEVSYLLPKECNKFPSLFRYLNSNKDQLEILGFGIKATTMEEVFLKSEIITEESELSHSFETSGSSMLKEEQDFCIEQFDALNQDLRLLTGYALSWCQFKALFHKRFLITLRHWLVMLALYAVPAFVIFLYMLISQATPKLYDDTMNKVIFNLEDYKRDGSASVFLVKTSESGDINIGKTYKRVVEDLGGEIVNVVPNATNTLDDILLDMQNYVGREQFEYKYPIGADIGHNKTIVALYNGQIYHALFTSISLVMQAVVKDLLGSTYDLTLALKPLPKVGEAELKYEMASHHRSGFLIGMFVGMGFAMYSASIVHFMVWERQTGVKHMHAISGVSMTMYWLPNFVWDALNFIPPTFLLFCLFHFTESPLFGDDTNVMFCMLAMTCYVWAILPTMYSMQFLFDTAASGLAGVLVYNLFSVLLACIIVFVLTRPGEDTKDLGLAIKAAVIVIVPPYNLAECFKLILVNFLTKHQCKEREAACEKGYNSLCCKDYPDLCFSSTESHDYCYDWYDNPVQWDIEKGIAPFLFALFIQGIVMWICIFAVEYSFLQKCSPKMSMKNKVDQEHAGKGYRTSEEDVDFERSRVIMQLQDKEQEDPMLIVGLRKLFGSVVAVDDLYLGVKESMCFGILGQSGAGKTTIFRMLTGEMSVSGGNAYLNEHDVRTHLREVQSQIGYCPQFDAHLGELTGTETLCLYGRLRGIPIKDIDEIVATLIKITLLGPHANRRCGNYSGGNRRKLSLAMALIGNPAFLLLDEPSCGVDPKARRQMWDILCKMRANGRTIIVSSHSMEECDALCTNLGILLNGRFMCIGSPQHLKNKYGQGFTLMIKMATLQNGAIAPIKPLVDFLQDTFTNTKVFDDHQGYVHLQIKDPKAELADVFSKMEDCRELFSVEDYSVSETTLEQIFLMFTMIQKQDSEPTAKSCWFLRAGFFDDHFCF